MISDFFCLFFSSFIQPLDQNVLEASKLRYRLALLLTLHYSVDSEMNTEKVVKTWKGVKLHHVVLNLAEA